MTATIALYAALTVTAAAWLVSHAVVLVQLARRGGLWPPTTWWALIPVVTPVALYRRGGRVAPLLWAGLLVAYGALQVAARA